MHAQLARGEISARRAAARGMRVKRTLSIAECATKYRRLSAKEASQSGKYDIERTPFFVEICEALQESHPAEIVDLLKPTQIGGTTVVQNWILWTLLESAATMMVLMPTEKIGL